MAETKNLCAQISIDLHRKICDEKDRAGLTTAQYITNLLSWQAMGGFFVLFDLVVLLALSMVLWWCW